MYYKNRQEAGRKIAKKLVPKYRYENVAIVALSDGGVIIGAEIAKQLHCVLTMLLTEEVKLPGESKPIAVVNQDGGFTYNNLFSAGQLEGFTSEYHTYIEQEKRQKFHAINRLLGEGGLIRRDLLYGHNVVLVSDGLNSGISLDAAQDFLKPIKIERLIIVTPLATVQAVDRMHIIADEIVCLDVVENYMNTNHYYDDNKLPSHETIVKTIETIVLNWK
jgi:predicted phosphoribosyltransferase